MDFDKLIADTKRTESVVDTIMVDEVLLQNTLQAAISIGEILDQIKKTAFFGREYKQDEMLNHVTTLSTVATTLAARLQSPAKTQNVIHTNTRVFHAVVGIATESTEMLQALVKMLGGADLDVVNLLEESFDVDWYQFILMDELGADLERVWTTGFDKLKARYPEKFTSTAANNRNLDLERAILENITEQKTQK